MRTGQVVRLKTSGILMAVAQIEEPPIPADHGEQVVDCVYNEGKGFVHGKFSSDSLEEVTCPHKTGAAA
jgi:hypothetical protein